MPSNITIERRADGFYRIAANGDAELVAPPIEIMYAIAPKAGNGNASIRLHFEDLAEQSLTVDLAPSLFHTSSRLRNELLDLCYALPFGAVGNAIAECLAAAPIEQTRIGVRRPGQQENEFVLPDITLTPSATNGGPKHIYVPPVAGAEQVLLSLNSLEAWRHGVGLKAKYSDLLLFALCAAFAAPLKRPMAVPNRVFHFIGDSQRGKSTLLRSAFSVYGRHFPEDPTGPLPTWDTTDTGFEERLLNLNDLIVVLDDTGNRDKKLSERDLMAMIKSIAFTVGNGHTRQRASAATKSFGLPEGSFSAIVLSNGEEAPDAIAAAHGVDRLKGEQLRFNTIDIGCAKASGIWDKLPDGAKNYMKATEVLNTDALTNYGVVGRHFIQAILDKPDLHERCRQLMERFYKEAEVPIDNYARTFAKPYALMAAAGALAIEAECLPVAETRVFRAIGRIYQSTQVRPASERWMLHQGLKALRDGLHSDQIVPVKTSAEVKLAKNILGYRYRFREQGTGFALIPRAFRDLFDTDVQADMVNDALERDGLRLSESGSGKRSTLQLSIPSVTGRKRYVCLSEATPAWIETQLAKSKKSPSGKSGKKAKTSSGGATGRARKGDAALKPRRSAKKQANPIATGKKKSNRQAGAAIKAKRVKRNVKK